MVALHGFTLTGAQFEPLAGTGLHVHAPDLPGHGATRITPVSIPTTVAALGHFLIRFRSPVPLMGYSQGGRIALLAALEYPDLVDRLVLVSASAGIRDESARAVRRSQDMVLANRIEAIGIDAFLDEWLVGPIAGTSHLDDHIRRRDRTMREENTAIGLAAALRGLGQGVQPYVGDRIGELRIPLLAITGGADATYGRLAIDMMDAARVGTHVAITGSGHNVILEEPDEVRHVVLEFIERQPAAE